MGLYKFFLSEKSQTVFCKAARCLVVPLAFFSVFVQAAVAQESTEVCLFTSVDPIEPKFCTEAIGLQNLPKDFGTTVSVVHFSFDYRVVLYADRDGKNACFDKPDDWYDKYQNALQKREREMGMPISNRGIWMVFKDCSGNVSSFKYELRK